jgi:predicted phage tail protein
MITIILRGKLGRQFGRDWKLDARSPADALYAINVMRPGFFDYIMELEAEMQGYHVEVNDKGIGANMLHFGFIDDTVSITPVLKGTDFSTKGIIELVAGIVLIAVAIVNPFGWAATVLYASGGYTITLGAVAVSVGLALALGGLASLLQSTPAITTPPTQKPNYVFNGPINTIIQGEPVPVCYGAPIIGSGVIDASITTTQVGHDRSDHRGGGGNGGNGGHGPPP